MTLDPDVEEYLGALTDRSRAVLAADLIGVYAAGSLALDAYEQGRSDIDIAVVCGPPMTPDGKHALVQALRHESLACPARGLELVVYRAEVAAAGDADPGFEVELNSGPRMPFLATYSGADRQTRDGTFWYAIDRSILAERGRAVHGPPATEVFRSVPDQELVKLMIASLRWHLGAETDVGEDDAPAAWTDDAVLNSCRAWQRISTGQWASKVAAGRQFVADLGAQHPGSATERINVVEQSLAARAGAAPPGVRSARQFQREILARLERLAGGR